MIGKMMPSGTRLIELSSLRQHLTHAFFLFFFTPDLHAVDRQVQAACKSAPAISPAIDKSSSNSGQWSEVPPPPISYLLRCSGVAWRNKGNHIIGALTRRPSVSE